MMPLVGYYANITVFANVMKSLEGFLEAPRA
jgi:hypothetical protein